MDNNPQPLSHPNSEPTVQTVLQTPLTTNPSIEIPRTSPVTVILLLLFFWPLAIYFMWREKRYHKWIANILIFVGVISLITVLGMSLFVIPKISQIYKDINSVKIPNLIIPQIIAFVISVSQLFFGVYLHKKASSPLPVPKPLLIIAIVLIVFYNISIAVSIYSAILPIYNLTSAIN